MNKNLIAFVLALSLVSVGNSGPISVEKAKSPAWRVPFTCSGISPGIVASLKKVGFELNALENGVPCLAQDYDGDGIQDFAFFLQVPIKDENGEENKNYFEWKIPVFLAKQNQLGQIKTLQLGMMSRSFEPCSKCCAEKRDGIKEVSGGDIDGTYCYAQKEGKWDRLPFW